MTPDKILRNLTNGYYMSHQEQEEAAAYIRQLQESNEVLKAGMIEFADTIFALKRELADLDPPFKLTDAGADTNITRGLEPKGKGWVTFNQPDPEHKPWCDYLNIMLTSMPPQKAKCNCKIAQPEQEPKLTDASADTNIVRGLEPKGSGMVALHQREWVGLTDGEIRNGQQEGEARSFRSAVRWVEAKLKEKNT